MDRLFHDRGFQIHLAAYVAVNLLLIAINLLTTPTVLWFFWPLLGWGIGILAHGAAVYYTSARYRRPRTAIGL
jgi:uncharacterized membrane protein